jgi:sugar lactone lactonase YvrE
MKSKIALSALAAAALLLLAGAASASAAIPFCLPGSGPGQCNEPQGIAVDSEEALVYVADSGNNRVNVFGVDGTFKSSFTVSGAPAWVAVDNNAASASHHDVYVSSNEFVVRKFSPAGALLDTLGEKGSGSCQFERANDPIAVGPAGKVYVADSYGDVPNHFINRVAVFDAAGACLETIKLFEGPDVTIRSLAVDSAGNIYVVAAAAGGIVRKFGPSGTLLYELGAGGEAEGIAVDGADDLFVKQNVQQKTKSAIVSFVSEYDSSGAVLKRFGYGVFRSVPGLAAHHIASGDVFPSEGAAGINYLKAPQGPALVPEPCHVKPGGLGSVKATLQGEVNPEGKATSFHFEYVTQAHFEAEGFATPAKTTETTLPGSADFELHEAAFTVNGLTPEATYHCRVVAKNADGEATGVEGTFKAREGFEFGPAWVSDVEESAATVNVEGNPLGLAANGEIEYVEDAAYEADIEAGGDGFANALKTAPGELDFGSGEAMVLRSVRIAGLDPGTGYHYRLRALNGVPPEGIICPELKLTCPELEHTFRTYLPEGAGESDDRHYELVSPGEKNSAEVAVPGTPAGFFEPRTIRIQAGATSGEAVTYTSWTSFGEAEGAPATNQYLSRRGAGGWETKNISPFGFLRNPLAPPFTGFTPDLRFAAMLTSEPSLAAGCPEEYGNLYLRDNESGALKCLSPEAPNSTVAFGNCFTFAGSSADGTHAYFSSLVPYAGTPTGEGASLYEWSASGGLKPVSILPGQSTPVAPARDTSFGAADGNCVTGLATMRHVVSADGSRAIWTYAPNGKGFEPVQLLDRVNGNETVQLDKVQTGGGKPGNGVFWTASTDGSVVYFTDVNRLIAGSDSVKGEEDLYRYEFGSPTPLTNLTLNSGNVPGDVRGVVGASDDGSYVYFTAGAVLSGAEENEAGQKAAAGKENLYLFHAGQTKFIATLDPRDEYVRSEQPRNLSARVSPDGRHLAFLSYASKALAGYDSTVADGRIVGNPPVHCVWDELTKEFEDDPTCAEAFLYDAEDGALHCVSCNPSGSRPLGPTLLPGWTNVYEGPRLLSDNGSRVFFETYDQLVAADENLKRDVYGFETPGEGTCTNASANFDPVSGGCHFLVSSGKDSDESYLVDASADGRDVFFSTRSRLTGWDVNDNFDVYDYRVGGGFPEPPTPAAACVSRASCKSPATPPPAPPTPATPTFTGPANAKPKQSKPKKNKKHKQKKHHKKKSKHHANKKGRAGR